MTKVKAAQSVYSAPFQRFQTRLERLKKVNENAFLRYAQLEKMHCDVNKELMQSLQARLLANETKSKKVKRVIGTKSPTNQKKKSRGTEALAGKVAQHKALSNTSTIQPHSDDVNLALLNDLKELPSLHPNEIEGVLSGNGSNASEYSSTKESKEPVFPPPTDEDSIVGYSPAGKAYLAHQHSFTSSSYSPSFSVSYGNYPITQYNTPTSYNSNGCQSVQSDQKCPGSEEYAILETVTQQHQQTTYGQNGSYQWYQCGADNAQTVNQTWSNCTVPFNQNSSATTGYNYSSSPYIVNHPTTTVHYDESYKNMVPPANPNPYSCYVPQAKTDQQPVQTELFNAQLTTGPVYGSYDACGQHNCSPTVSTVNTNPLLASIYSSDGVGLSHQSELSRSEYKSLSASKPCVTQNSFFVATGSSAKQTLR